MSTTHRMTLAEWALLGLLSLLWGGSFFFAKIAVQALAPLTVVFVRVALAAAVLGLYLRWRGTKLPRGAALWQSFIGMGLLNNLIPFVLIFWGTDDPVERARLRSQCHDASVLAARRPRPDLGRETRAA